MATTAVTITKLAKAIGGEREAIATADRERWAASVLDWDSVQIASAEYQKRSR
jgi:hypothetical protein